jgi:Ca-activated chloride channel family protein
MNWPGFSALSAAWLFALLGPLILFYFLKLRRPRVDISSLALWRQVISDQRVNSPFQKFKRNLLLLLQILLLCMLALAAMQPFWPSGADRAQYIPVLIDCSASMGALDRAGGESRLDAAKTEVRKLIDNLLPNQRLSLIAVDNTARRLTDFTDNQRVLHDALNGLAVRPVASRLEDGLRMAQALTRMAPVQAVVLITDGNVPAALDFELPFRLTYQKLPPAGANLGITDFNARRNPTGWDVFARLDGSAGLRGLVEVELLQNGQPLKKDSVTVEEGQAARWSFQIETADAASLELRIRPDQFDTLAADNVSFLELPAPRRLTVYCPTELASYRHALSALKDVNLFPREGETDPFAVDLRFTDQPLNAGPKARVTFHTGVVPEDLQALVAIEPALVDVVDWTRTAPLLRHVQLLDVQIGDDPVSQPGIGERDYELAGYEVLAQGTRGPLILERPTNTGVDYFLLFHTDRSSLPYRVGFPILVANAAQIALERAALSEARSWPTGTLPPQKVDAETEYTINEPGGRIDTVRSSNDGTLSGVAATEAGRYVIRQGEQPVTSLGVSLLAASESQLTTVEKLQFPETSVTTSTELVKSDRPLWGWFAWAGLVLLLGEWWYFQHRPGGVPA